MADSDIINGIETKNITKVIGIEGKHITHMGGSVIKFAPLVPLGLIVPLNDSVIPSGWDAFNSANSRMIVGAGSTYVPGATGGTNIGSSLGNLGGGSGTSGSHAASPQMGGFYGTGGATSPKAAYSQAIGDHSHTFGNTVISNIDRNLFRLIKANVEQDILPAKAVAISASSLASLGMTNINANNKMFCGNASTTTSAKSGYVTVGSAGDHYHNYYSSYGPSGSQTVSFLQENMTGAHSSNVTLNTITQNFKRLLLSLWSNASAEIEAQEGMIAMWESLTPPDGWFICNGDNGTPDLRNNFIQNCSSGAENITSQGNNQITCGLSGNFTHSKSHHHSGNWQNWSGSYPSYHSASHSTIAWSHSHSASRSIAFGFLPYYYALSFIMKAA